jgi:radical SAM superfamily enzyme YgiQ (UPF0313 family)
MGFGVYIWNVTQTTEVVAMLKKLRPDITIILGGPEVSYETEQQEIVALADHVITGEADVKFAEVCRRLLNDETRRGERSEAMANDEEMPELELHSPFVIRHYRRCILKRLRGTPIVRHDDEHGMLYAPHPPYEILATWAIPFGFPLSRCSACAASPATGTSWRTAAISPAR